MRPAFFAAASLLAACAGSPPAAAPAAAPSPAAAPLPAAAPAAPVHEARAAPGIPGLTCAADLKGGGRVEARFAADRATVVHTPPKGPARERAYPGLAWTWDGHLTGTAKARGIDLRYESHYGCVRNATLRLRGELDLGPVEIPLCQGGGTNDDLCAGR